MITEYRYLLTDRSAVPCVDLGNGQAAATELGLGPMPQGELHEALEMLSGALLALDEGTTSREPGGWTLTRTGLSSWRVEARGRRPLLVTAPTLADALAACRNARERARRDRLDVGFPVGWELVRDGVGCAALYLTFVVALPWIFWS